MVQRRALAANFVQIRLSSWISNESYEYYVKKVHNCPACLFLCRPFPRDPRGCIAPPSSEFREETLETFHIPWWNFHRLGFCSLHGTGKSLSRISRLQIQVRCTCNSRILHMHSGIGPWHDNRHFFASSTDTCTPPGRAQKVKGPVHGAAIVYAWFEPDLSYASGICATVSVVCL